MHIFLINKNIICSLHHFDPKKISHFFSRSIISNLSIIDFLNSTNISSSFSVNIRSLTQRHTIKILRTFLVLMNKVCSYLHFQTAFHKVRLYTSIPTISTSQGLFKSMHIFFYFTYLLLISFMLIVRRGCLIKTHQV